MTEIYIILIVMIVGSIAALQTKDLFSSVVLIAAVGLCMSVGFVLLQAPDLAMAQLVVEIILVIILIQGTLGKDTNSSNGKKHNFDKFCLLSIFLIILVNVFYVTLSLPIFGKPLMRISIGYIEAAQNKLNVTNVLSAILLDFRVFDTFAAILAVFASAIAVLAIGRGEKLKKNEE